jgi:hypothetical protein
MRLAWLAMFCTLSACGGHDVRAHFPAMPDEPTGTLVLLMSQSASDVSVAINGVLVVQDEHTSRIVIDGVPVGNDEIVMAANGMDKQFHTWIGGDHATTVPLGVPEPGSGFAKSLFATLLTIVVYSLLHH